MSNRSYPFLFRTESERDHNTKKRLDTIETKLDIMETKLDLIIQMQVICFVCSQSLFIFLF